ncbi:MAG TPA: TetR/AcrR family transcriptional regulator [Micrococcales bacterium]|uniref:TetR/AcrR family transcriptional regulator n=1 Tax=Miniimonas arenae TaxID=676201 RepID=UPI000EE1207A|nr:TetR/AcrR family transcriptional regulator [Miniimonas arenae]HCX84686.1 TetR/AcrR family transcriptional regulator [Micrococcales bacterium]
MPTSPPRSPSGSRASAEATPPARTRVRLTPEERRSQVVAASVRLVSEHGFYGISLQDVADEVGLSVPGLLHYVGTKEGLLQLLVEQGYDRRFDPDDFVATGDPDAVHSEGVSFPAYCRYLVRHNAENPQLMKLYLVLGAEAASDGHPAHAYFVDRPRSVWELYRRTRWRVPPAVGTFDDMRDLVEMTLAAMDGLQARWFRRPAIDLVAEWAKFEGVLFPSPVWDGYR